MSTNTFLALQNFRVSLSPSEIPPLAVDENKHRDTLDNVLRAIDFGPNPTWDVSIESLLSGLRECCRRGKDCRSQRRWKSSKETRLSRHNRTGRDSDNMHSACIGLRPMLRGEEDTNPCPKTEAISS